MNDAPSTRHDEDLLERVSLIARYSWDGSGFWAWSSGEKLCVAMICEYASRITTHLVRPGCDSRQILSAMGYTVAEAETFCAEQFFGGNVFTSSRWLQALASRSEVVG